MDSVLQRPLRHPGHLGDSAVRDEVLPRHGRFPGHMRRQNAGHLLADWVRPNDAAFPRRGRATSSTPYRGPAAPALSPGLSGTFGRPGVLNLSTINILGWRILPYGGAVLSLLVGFAVSLASTHWMPVSPSLPLQIVKTQTVCRQCPMSPGGNISPC